MQEERNADRRNMLQNALAAIERLQEQLEAERSARQEPIAIVGMACRAPGGVTDPDGLWKLLEEGRDAVGEVPPDRWNVDSYYDPDPNAMGKSRTKACASIENIGDFDPAFFGMSPREASQVDPQQRLVLEVSWEAFEHAGIPVDQLDGSLTGVFVGITGMDYANRLDLSDPARSDVYLATGITLNAAAGRVSFTYGLRGPCMAIDTACSSSLVAIHTACQSLRNRDSDLVVAGGVNAVLSPDPFVLISKWGMLSPDGRCKTFDASADGFVRGEGCGMLVLERLSDAVAKGRRILAVIPGSAINQDGRSSGLTVPNGLAQQEVVRLALGSARLKPTDVSYVEAHGTGTSLGDPIEVEALAAVYCEGRSRDEPLELGSLKSNIGHLESASGVMSLIKLVKALEHKQLPASLHVKTLTPAIAWDSIPVRVSTTLHDWKTARRRIAGASGFGFSGMNAHILVAEAPEVASAPVTVQERPLYALPLSAKSEPALRALARRYADHLEARADQSLADVCATASIGRSHLVLRTLLTAPDRAAMVTQLRALAAGESVATRGFAAADRHRVAFLFTGQGAQYVGMGRELYASEPVFRDALDRCAAVLDPLLGRSLLEVMFEETGGLLDQTGFTQPALFAIEVGLAALWRSWGLEPSVVIGHSVGEFAAAVVAGVFSLEDGARLIAARGRLMQALPAGGAMVSVQGDTATVQREVAAHEDKVSIAAYNAPGNVVIAGEAAEVAAMAARLAAQGMNTKALVVSHAFHSPLMAPMMDEFHQVAAKVVHSQPTITWISNLTGAALDWSAWGDRMADYWTTHVREPVAFERGMAALDAAACDVHIEVGPHPTLTALGKQCIPSARQIDWLPSLKRARGAWEQVLDSVAGLYLRGTRLDWKAIQPAGARHNVTLPTYPYQRERYFMPFIPKGRRLLGDVAHDLLGARVQMAGVAAQFERAVNLANPAWVADHRVAGEAVMPLTAYLEAAIAAAREANPAAAEAVESIEVSEPLAVREGEERLMQVSVDQPGSGPARIRVFSRDASGNVADWTLHATLVAGSATEPGPASLAKVAQSLTHVVDIEAVYEKLRNLGIDYGPGFRLMRRAWSGEGEAIAEIEIPEELAEEAARQRFHPAVLDACFHAGAVALDTLPGADDGTMYLPIGLDRYRWFGPATGVLRSHAKIRSFDVKSEMRITDLRIETLDGKPVAVVEGLRSRRASRDMFRQRVEGRASEWLYENAWKAQPLAAAAGLAPAGTWLVLDDGEGSGSRLAEEIGKRGGKVVRAVPREAPSQGAVAIDAASAPDYTRALVQASEAGPIAGIVSLWPLRVPEPGATDVPSALQRFGTDSALLLLQSVLGVPAERVPRLWLITRGSQAVDGTERVRISQAPVAGFARVAANEHPDMRVTLVDLDPQAGTGDVRLLADELFAGGDETQVALRKGARFVARMARRPRRVAAHVDDAPLHLHVGQKGILESLAIIASERRAPGPGEVEIRVRSSGINFRDVLGAMGMYPGEIKRLGADCAGEVIAVGEGVKHVSPGDRVVAIAPGAFASHVTTGAGLVARIPDGMDFETAAAIPTAHMTSAVTLEYIAKMKKGDKVLIHSGAGGVGMAAIALARRAGAEIFTTAGSPDKRALVKSLGAHHVLDSRSTSFADDLLRITNGRGVDIVLNSLAGAMLDRSFDCVAKGGVFIEIGKRGLWTQEQVTALKRDIRYHIVDLADYLRDEPAKMDEMFATLVAEIGSGVLPSSPVTSFPFENAQEAFRYMAQAKHTGRVVFHHRVEPRRMEQLVHADATYLVTGGLRGLGLLAAQWLAGEGARKLVLAGRSAPDATARVAIDALEASGVKVVTVSADVGTAVGVERTMACLKEFAERLGGVIHCAGILDDGVLVRQTPARFATVMGPKADAAWRLAVAMEQHGHRPDFFVMYSSMAATFGTAGQGNYAAANAFLDALAHSRRADDKPALSVNWGAWSEIGMAARSTTVARATAGGLSAFSPTAGMQVLGLLMRDGAVQAVAAPIDWQKLLQQTAGNVPLLLTDLAAAEQGRGGGGGEQDEARIDFSALDAGERLPQLLVLVQRELAKVLGLGVGAAQSIPVEQPFTSLGMDSLTSVELRNRLQQAIGRSVAATAVFEWPSVARMAEHLDSIFGGAEAPAEDESEREKLTL